MSASAEQTLIELAEAAREARAGLKGSVDAERRATVAFMDEALLARWSWNRIADVLSVSDVAARRYYQRNRQKVRSV